MKTGLLAASMLLALVATNRAYAQDSAPETLVPPASSWTGFYAGVHGGGSFGENDGNELEFDNDGDGVFDDVLAAFAPGVNNPDVYQSDFSDGINIGGRLGYDWQFGTFVLGAVVDASYVDIDDFTNGISATPADYTFERDLDFLATGRLRGGLAFDRFLVYATGGVAYGSIETDFISDTGATIVDEDTGDDDAWGYTVGGGVEALLTPRVSVGVEYLYTDLDAGTAEVTLSGPGAPGGPFGAGTDIRPTDDEFDSTRSAPPSPIGSTAASRTSDKPRARREGPAEEPGPLLLRAAETMGGGRGEC